MLNLLIHLLCWPLVVLAVFAGAKALHSIREGRWL